MELRPVFDGLVDAAASLPHDSRPCPSCSVFAPLLEEMQTLLGKWEGTP